MQVSWPPYVNYAVSEVSCVTSMEMWSNTKVKVLGRLQDYDSEALTALLECVDKPDLFKIEVSGCDSIY